MSQVMEHVRQLAEVIGPRPAATDAEANAADYIEDVFRARGLEVERQEFDCPRTAAWAYVACHLLTLGAVALAFWLPVAALAPAVLAAIVLVLELDTRPVLSRLMPKGPSQNIIARHVPRQRRGERLKRVIIVAHYDSARPSLASSPGAVKNYRLFGAVALWMTLLTPLAILVAALPFAAEWKPWTLYATLAIGGGLIVPVLVNIHREIFMHPTDGANDNASGVAAMLGVMEATVPEPDDVQFKDRPHRRSLDTAYAAGVAPDEALLEYRSVGSGSVAPAEPMPLDGFGDVDWETGRLEPVTPAPAAPRPAVPASGDWAEDAGVGPLWEEPLREQAPPLAAATPTPWRESRPASTRPAPSPVPARWDTVPPTTSADDEVAEGQERLAFETPEAKSTAAPETESGDKHQAHGISAWLGIGKGFDVRKAGKQIGSWDNIEEDDEFGFKAGTAGDPVFGDDDVTSDVAARIRRRVTENVDRALSEKEIWFVATGADEVGLHGMRAFLDSHREELEDALIINLESVGAGAVSFITDEGLARTYRSDRRLVTQAKRTVRENGLSVKGRSYRRMQTSATAALARRFKAMSVMAFDINGRVPNWHWHTDTVDSVVDTTIEQATGFVTALVRDL